MHTTQRTLIHTFESDYFKTDGKRLISYLKRRRENKKKIRQPDVHKAIVQVGNERITSIAYVRSINRQFQTRFISE